MTIDTLINKQDTSEIVRDQIAAILASETVAQQALATAAAEDPENWRFKVYLERSQPFNDWLNADLETLDPAPLVNVSIDNYSCSERMGDPVTRQQSEAIFNIDCYGLGRARTNGVGHIAGDKDAALECQRIVRLVRNILMSANYIHLGLKGTVGKRWVTGVEFYDVPQEQRTVQQVMAARVRLMVTYNEFGPQHTPTTLEYLAVDILDGGQVLIEADYDYTD